MAIDTVLTFNDGTVITLQEKSRRNFYYDRYGEIFTFEYYNDPRVKEEGEWFKLAAQLYFYGFVNAGENGYYKFWLLDVAKLRLCLTRRVGIAQLEREYLRYNKAPAKANFFAIPFEIIGGECIMYVGGEVTGKAALGGEGMYAQKAALKTV